MLKIHETVLLRKRHSLSRIPCMHLCVPMYVGWRTYVGRRRLSLYRCQEKRIEQTHNTLKNNKTPAIGLTHQSLGVVGPWGDRRQCCAAPEAAQAAGGRPGTTESAPSLHRPTPRAEPSLHAAARPSACRLTEVAPETGTGGRCVGLNPFMPRNIGYHENQWSCNMSILLPVTCMELKILFACSNNFSRKV